MSGQVIIVSFVIAASRDPAEKLEASFIYNSASQPSSSLSASSQLLTIGKSHLLFLLCSFSASSLRRYSYFLQPAQTLGSSPEDLSYKFSQKRISCSYSQESRQNYARHAKYIDLLEQATAQPVRIVSKYLTITADLWETAQVNETIVSLCFFLEVQSFRW